jgi:hypothetical protein
MRFDPVFYGYPVFQSGIYFGIKDLLETGSV